MWPSAPSQELICHCMAETLAVCVGIPTNKALFADRKCIQSKVATETFGNLSVCTVLCTVTFMLLNMCKIILEVTISVLNPSTKHLREGPSSKMYTVVHAF